MSAGFWVDSTYPYMVPMGARYYSHQDGVFTFHALKSDRPDYFVWFDRVDAGGGKEYGYFASLDEAEAYITARRGNYYSVLSRVTVL